MRVELSRDSSRYFGLIMLAACAALGGRKAKDTATTDTTSAMSAISNSATGDHASPGAETSNAAGGAAMKDANIAALVDETNMGDSALAAAALPKLTSTGAKNFVKLMMMREHHAIHVQGIQVEKAQNITSVLPIPDPFKPAVEAEQRALSPMSKGAAYDSTYIAHEVGIHRAVIDWAGKNPPQNAAYQQYLKTAGPVYQKHLNHALALQKTMSGSKS